MGESCSRQRHSSNDEEHSKKENMIASLAGKIDKKYEKGVVIDVQGVGYFVHITPRTMEALGGVGESVKLRTYLDVKEDSMNLFGFQSESEYDLFLLLNGVNGIGPRSALAILDAGTPTDIQNAIAHEDSAVFKRVSGIGKKTAERIILELKDKVGSIAGGVDDYTPTGGSQDLYDALMSLGYREKDLHTAVDQVPKDLPLEEQIRHVLKQIKN
jgi:Holliday junction DNA helicase RuvA